MGKCGNGIEVTDGNGNGMGMGMKSLKWEGIGTKNLFPHTSTVSRWWRGGATLLDVGLAIKRGREFDPRPGRGCVLRLWASCSHPTASTLTLFVSI